jgi:homoserine kinase type II
MEHLAANGVPCPALLRVKNGELIQRVKNKPAIIVTFLEGKSANTIQNENMSELGANIARMHLGAKGYALSRPNALSLSGWGGLLAKISARADEIAPGLALELKTELEALQTLWPRHLPSGVIHADLFPDNVFYNDANKLTGLIDFYFACNDYLSYELAICLNAWCFEQTREFNVTKARLMLKSYHAVRPISGAEFEALPVLARGAALCFLLTRSYDWLFPVEGALVTPKDPMEYLKKLRFHRSVKHHKEYGL